VLLSRGLLQLAPDTPLERYAKAAEAAKAAGVGLWGK
jgi:endonuclease YncB( thermonuclease family)